MASFSGHILRLHFLSLSIFEATARPPSWLSREPSHAPSVTNIDCLDKRLTC